MASIQAPVHTVVIDGGEVGLAGQGGHGHNDLLSFELVLSGKPVVVDPGVLTYNGPASRHRLDRTSARHNTLMVDGQELAPLTGRWTIGADAVPDPLVMTPGAVIQVTGGHQGYARLATPVHHRREWRFDPVGGRLEVRDSLVGEGGHEVTRHLHLAPGLLCRKGSRTVQLEGEGCTWHLWWEDDAEVELAEEGVAASYGTDRPGMVVRLRNRVSLPAWLCFGIVPV